MKIIFRPKGLLLFPLAILSIGGCNKDIKFLSRNTGTWEIQSMQVDYVNVSGGTDSTTTSVTGFFMFYDTPSSGSNPVYLNTHAITIRGNETHGAAFWQSDGKTISLLPAASNSPIREYKISNAKRDDMTLDYSGPLNYMYYGPSTGTVKEHIVLKRVKY